MGNSATVEFDERTILSFHGANTSTPIYHLTDDDVVDFNEAHAAYKRYLEDPKSYDLDSLLKENGLSD